MPRLCADCDGISYEPPGEPESRCGWHQQEYDKAVLRDALFDLEAHLEDNLATDLWVDQWRLACVNLSLLTC